MKIKSASVTFEHEGTEKSISFPEMPIKEMAHELLKLCTPEIEIKLTDERKLRFEIEARKAYTKEPGVFTDYEAWVRLWVKKETEKYFAIERANHAYNLAVLELSKKV